MPSTLTVRRINASPDMFKSRDQRSVNDKAFGACDVGWTFSSCPMNMHTRVYNHDSSSPLLLKLYIWFPSRKRQNQEQHALNGNTSGSSSVWIKLIRTGKDDVVEEIDYDGGYVSRLRKAICNQMHLTVPAHELLVYPVATQENSAELNPGDYVPMATSDNPLIVKWSPENNWNPPRRWRNKQAHILHGNILWDAFVAAVSEYIENNHFDMKEDLTAATLEFIAEYRSDKLGTPESLADGIEQKQITGHYSIMNVILETISGYVWVSSKLNRNQAVHALNGNINWTGLREALQEKLTSEELPKENIDPILKLFDDYHDALPPTMTPSLFLKRKKEGRLKHCPEDLADHLEDVMDNLPKAQSAKRQKPSGWDVRFINGVDVHNPGTIKRSVLVNAVKQKSNESEAVFIKGPAGCGKTSLLQLLGESYKIDGVPVAYIVSESSLSYQAHIEKFQNSFSAISGDDVLKIVLWDEIHRLYTGDDHDWTDFLKQPYLVNNNVRIIAASTRCVLGDTQSPAMDESKVIGYDRLRLTESEQQDLIQKILKPRDFQALREVFQDESIKNHVLCAVLDQCGGHVYAIKQTLEALSDFVRNVGNRTQKMLISCVLSNVTLMQYTRIWAGNCLSWPGPTIEVPRTGATITVMELDVRDAVRGAKETTIEIQEALKKFHMLKSTTKAVDNQPWYVVKEEFVSKLAYRYLMYHLFPDRGPDDYEPKSIDALLNDALSRFSQTNLVQGAGASKTSFFPKETAIQHEFYRCLVSLLPANTEVVSEMSAILPEVEGHGVGELDFYVNRGYFYGFELMRKGSNLQEHVARFAPGGKYYTPKIKDFLVVDFVEEACRPTKWYKCRRVVKFAKDFSRCELWNNNMKIQSVTFQG
eukprot:m.329233 g.329233  ORF g.329233 m.329233 type:complete len:875 (+) comp16566_c0_seq50:227-2851(+)